MTRPGLLKLLSDEEQREEVDAALAELVPLVTHYGFQHPARNARQLLCILNAGRWANAAAGWRREWLPEIAQFQSALDEMIARAENAPYPVIGCPSLAEFIQHAELLKEEVATLSDGYSQTSWTTKRPDEMRRISWDLADHWEAGTGTMAKVWRHSSDHGERASGGNFLGYLDAICTLLGRPSPKAPAVEEWLRERRNNDADYSEQPSGTE